MREEIRASGAAVGRNQGLKCRFGRVNSKVKSTTDLGALTDARRNCRWRKRQLFLPIHCNGSMSLEVQSARLSPLDVDTDAIRLPHLFQQLDGDTGIRVDKAIALADVESCGFQVWY